MNFSSYYEELFEASLNGAEMPDAKLSTSANVDNSKTEDLANQPPVELTNEIIREKFWTFFERDPSGNIIKHFDLVAMFKGAGLRFILDKNIMNTWSFMDYTGKIWFVPQWFTLNEAQGDFKGFAQEDPAENFIYFIHYIEKNGDRHQLKIFRKKQ